MEQDLQGAQAPHETIVSGLSGNEMYCIDKLGYHPVNLLVGNSVYSIGFLGSIGSSFKINVMDIEVI